MVVGGIKTLLSSQSKPSHLEM